MKRGQGGINSAILVAIIAGLIVLYILFLPSVERERFFEGEIRGGGSSASSRGNKILLQEFPGRLDIIKKIEDKKIPNVFLFETTNAKELERINPFIVRNGWFDKKTNVVSFFLDNLADIDNVVLAFAAKKRNGILMIKLNGETIFENEIISENIEPVSLRKNLLKNSNTLDFSVSSVGIKFWATNEYQLENIRIVGDVTDRSRQEAQNIFNLKSEEFFNIEKATLKFVPYCKNIQDVGILDITVNNRNVFSAVPVCDDPYRQVIPTGIFNTGENRIILKTSKGSYSVEQIELNFDTKETKTNVYYFEVNETIFNKIRNESKDAILTIEFVDDRENKRADLNINDHLISFDQNDKIFSRNIRNDIRKGNNFIQIRPRTVIDIVEIKVEVQE